MKIFGLLLSTIVALCAAQANAFSDFEKVTHKVFLDVEIEGGPKGRIVLGLFGITLPLTVENFRALMTGEKGVGKQGKPLHYKGSIFHRIKPDFIIQGGDIINGDGTGGESVYGRYFPDESFALKHSAAYYLGMTNSGPNSNSSGFYITSRKAQWLDGRHVVFGRVLEGEEMVESISTYGTEGDEAGTPTAKVTIVDCGELESPLLQY